MKLFQSPVHAAAGIQAEATARKGAFIFICRPLYFRFNFSLFVAPPANGDTGARQGGGRVAEPREVDEMESLAVAFPFPPGLNPPSGETRQFFLQCR